MPYLSKSLPRITGTCFGERILSARNFLLFPVFIPGKAQYIVHYFIWQIKGQYIGKSPDDISIYASIVMHYG